jgi:hypothetical protein
MKSFKLLVLRADPDRTIRQGACELEGGQDGEPGPICPELVRDSFVGSVHTHF